MCIYRICVRKCTGQGGGGLSVDRKNGAAKQRHIIIAYHLQLVLFIVVVVLAVTWQTVKSGLNATN